MSTYTFRVHAIQKMFERKISRDDVVHVIETGEVIRRYDDDKPFPSQLLLGWVGKRPLHVVAAITITPEGTIIITAYEPDADIWESDFKNKKEPTT